MSLQAAGGAGTVTRVRIVTTGYTPDFPVADLVPHPLNPNESDVARLDASLASLGFYGAVIAQESTRLVLGGHGRLERAVAAGATTVPVLWLQVDDQAARRILISDNATARAAHWDPHGMGDLLARRDELGGLAALGLTQAEADNYLAPQTEWTPPAAEGSLEDFRREDGNQHALRVPLAHQDLVESALVLVRRIEVEPGWTDSQAVVAVCRDYLARQA